MTIQNGTKTDGRAATPINAAKKLRSLIQTPEQILLCPGVYDGFSARIALSVGFDALYMVRGEELPP